VQESQQPHEIALRLHGDDGRAESPPAPHAVADVRTDVEAERARMDETSIELRHPAGAKRHTVVDRERTRDAEPARRSAEEPTLVRRSRRAHPVTVARGSTRRLCSSERRGAPTPNAPARRSPPHRRTTQSIAKQ